MSSTLVPILAFFVLSYSSVLMAQGVLPQIIPAPKDNPTTAAKVELGKKLFFDPRISSSGTVSCNSCHNLMTAGDDSRATSVGIDGKQGDRSSPTVYNAGFYSAQFWDGRAPSLEEQAKGPLTNPVEMGMKNHAVVLTVINSIPEYVEDFAKIFPKDSTITIDHFAKVVAAFERTLVVGNSAYDRCTKGEKSKCNPAAVRGLATAQEIGCLACHSGPHFSGPQLPDGVGFFQKFPTYSDNEYVKSYSLSEDPGRFRVTKADSDKNMWRVPSWRNVALTAPYFHNGKVNSLGLAVKVMAKTQLNRDLTEQQVSDIVAFLSSLSGEFPKIQMPRLPIVVETSLLLPRQAH